MPFFRKKKPIKTHEKASKPKPKVATKEVREAWIVVACGAKGSGKTVRTVQEIEAYTKAHQKPVVIFDINMEVDYSKYKVIAIKDLKKLRKAEIRRVIPFHQDGTEFEIGEKEDALSKILKAFSKGCVVIEDINKYVISMRTKSILGQITTNRHRGQDIIIHLQNISKLDPTLWENTNLIRYHAQNEFSPSVKSRLPHLELISLTDLILKEALKENKYYFIYINIQQYHIFGISRDQFKVASTTFLNKNRKQLAELYNELDIKPNAENKEKAVNLFIDQRQTWYQQ